MKLKTALLWVPTAAALGYSIWYWSTDHSTLAAWYRSLFNGFYNSSNWESDFFTPAVKATGNWWCVATLFSMGIATRWIQKHLPQQWEWPARLPILPVLCIGTVATVFALWMSNNAAYATDEVFSADTFAKLPAFQTVSFYPLPNNHLFFNVLNGSLFSYASNLMESGRLISAFCYGAVMVITWWFLRRYIKPDWLVVVSLLFIGVQFPVLGFATQARGYELGLLMSCGAVFTVLRYFESRRTSFLFFSIPFSVMGMFNIPTFIYWWGALVLFGMVYQVREKKADPVFNTLFLFSSGLVLWSYLPLLTFSGASALTGNRYVLPETGSWLHFLTGPNTINYWKGLFAEWYSIPNESIIPGLGIWLGTGLLLFLQRKKAGFAPLHTLFWCITIALIAVAAGMRKWPFYRNLTAQGYFFLLLLVTGFTHLKNEKWWKITTGIFLAAGAAWGLHTSLKKIPDQLYYYPVNAHYEQLKSCDWAIPPGSSVFLEEEAFYIKGVLTEEAKKNQWEIQQNAANFNGQDYLILKENSKFPLDTVQYKVVLKCGEYWLFH